MKPLCLFMLLSVGLAMMLSWWALRSRTLITLLQRVVLATLMALVAVLLSLLLVVLRACQTFSGETLVARVSVRSLEHDCFELTYRPESRVPRVMTVAQLEGDQWALSGGIIKWHPWLTFLGMKSAHRPTRLIGQFSDLKRARRIPQTIVPLNGGEDRVWTWWFWAAPSLPFVEAVYGSSSFIFVDPAHEADIYVTPSGYLIKRATLEFTHDLRYTNPR